MDAPNVPATHAAARDRRELRDDPAGEPESRPGEVPVLRASQVNQAAAQGATAISNSYGGSESSGAMSTRPTTITAAR